MGDPNGSIDITSTRDSMIDEYELFLDIWYANLDHQRESDVYFRYLLEAPLCVSPMSMKSQSQFGGEIRLQSKRRDFVHRANCEQTNSKDPTRGFFFKIYKTKKTETRSY